LLSNFVGVAALIGVLGLVEGFRRRFDVHLGLATIFLGHLAFVLTYDVGDKELMLVPTFLVWGIWLALGVEVLARLVPVWSEGKVAVPVGAFLLMLAAGNLLINFSRVDLSHDWSARRQGEELFAYLPPGAVYVGGWGEVPVLEYLQRVENRRDDVEILNIFLATPEERVRFVERRLRAGRTVFVADRVQIPDVKATFEYIAACKCYRARAGNTDAELAAPPGGG
jgi:hypothetical protein